MLNTVLSSSSKQQQVQAAMPCLQGGIATGPMLDSHVKFEKEYVAILNDILLAFRPQ